MVCDIGGKKQDEAPEKWTKNHKPDKSNPNPALVRIIIRAIFRNSDDIPKILPSIRLRTYGPRTIPVSNIPSKLGSFIFWHIHPHRHTNY